MSRNSSSFEELLRVLREFKLVRSPFNEKEIEKELELFLKKRGFQVGRQGVYAYGRFDLTVESIDGKAQYCLELKKNATTKCAEQIDRYARNNFDGLALVCWKATAPLRQVFKIGKTRSTIPIELIEIRKQCDRV